MNNGIKTHKLSFKRVNAMGKVNCATMKRETVIAPRRGLRDGTAIGVSRNMSEMQRIVLPATVSLPVSPNCVSHCVIFR